MLRTLQIIGQKQTERKRMTDNESKTIQDDQSTGSDVSGCSAFGVAISQLIAESEQYQSCMSLSLNETGNCVELFLDTSIAFYSEWIKGEGGDVCLHRSEENDRVVGVTLPLMNSRLSINHNGPIKVNEGFRFNGE